MSETPAGQRKERRLKIDIEAFTAEVTSNLALDGYSAIQVLEDYFTMVLEYLPGAKELGRGDFLTTASEDEIQLFSYRFLATIDANLTPGAYGKPSSYTRQDLNFLRSEMSKWPLPAPRRTFHGPEDPQFYSDVYERQVQGRRYGLAGPGLTPGKWPDFPL